MRSASPLRHHFRNSCAVHRSLVTGAKRDLSSRPKWPSLFLRAPFARWATQRRDLGLIVAPLQSRRSPSPLLHHFRNSCAVHRSLVTGAKRDLSSRPKWPSLFLRAPFPRWATQRRDLGLIVAPLQSMRSASPLLHHFRNSCAVHRSLVTGAKRDLSSRPKWPSLFLRAPFARWATQRRDLGLIVAPLQSMRSASPLRHHFRNSFSILPRIRRPVIHPRRKIPHHRLSAPHLTRKRPQHPDLVPAFLEFLPRLRRKPVLHHHVASRKRVLRESRRFHRRLNIHFEVRYVSHKLRMRLRLVPSAHDSERDPRLALLRERRNDRM